ARNAREHLVGRRNKLIFLDIGVKVIVEEVLDLQHIGSCLLEMCGSLKGSDARLDGKALGIEVNTRKQSLRLSPRKGLIGQHILQKLGNQLTGGAGIGLVHGYCRILYIIRRPSVMVY